MHIYILYPPLFGTGGTLFMSPEHAYQTMTIWHCLGKEHKLAEEVTAAEDGYQAKSVSKNVPYSKSWEQKKKSIVAEICQIRSDQDVAFRDTLNESMNKKIVHNVNNNYWGTGGPDRSGLNTYGKILENLRKLLKDQEQSWIPNDQENPEKEEDLSSEHGERSVQMEALVMNKNTETLLITDSVLKLVEPKRFRGRRWVNKQRVSDSDELVSVLKTVNPKKHKLSEVVVHVGINDITDGKPISHIRDNFEEAIQDINDKLPNVSIVISAMVAKEYHKVAQANKELQRLCSKYQGCTFVTHRMRDHMYNDPIHVTSEGTAVLVADITRSIQSPQPTDNSQRRSFKSTSYARRGHERNDSYRPSWRRNTEHLNGRDYDNYQHKENTYRQYSHDNDHYYNHNEHIYPNDHYY